MEEKDRFFLFSECVCLEGTAEKEEASSLVFCYNH